MSHRGFKDTSQVAGPFFAIVMATNRPESMVGFLRNLQETAADPTSFEVLIRADAGDTATIEAIEAYKATASYRIVLLVEPNVKKTYQLHKAYNRLIKEFSSPSVYFFCNLTDEIRFESIGWDNEIKRYIGFFDDDIVRLRISKNNVRNYFNIDQSISMPDNYSVISRRWLQMIDGWGDYWGTDSWLQCVDFYLGRCRIPEPPLGIFRSIPIYTVQMSGQEAGHAVSLSEQHFRARMIDNSWQILLSPKAMENYSRLAHRLRAYIIARQMGLDAFLLIEDRRNKTISVSESLGQPVLAAWSYVSDAQSRDNAYISLQHSAYMRLKPLIGPTLAWDVIRHLKYGNLRVLVNSAASVRSILVMVLGSPRYADVIAAVKRSGLSARKIFTLLSLVLTLLILLPFLLPFLLASLIYHHFTDEKIPTPKASPDLTIYHYSDHFDHFFPSDYHDIAKLIDAL